MVRLICPICQSGFESFDEFIKCGSCRLKEKDDPSLHNSEGI